jgi:hypothetical protein
LSVIGYLDKQLMGINIARFFNQAVTNGRLLTVLMVALTYIILIIISDFFIFPLIFPATGNYGEYDMHHIYTMVTISEISFLPFVIGTVYSYLLRGHKYTIEEKDVTGKTGTAGSNLALPLAVSGILTFMPVLAFILIADPVSSEGWLRSIFISLLIASFTPLIFLLGIKMNKGRLFRLAMIVISLLLTFSLPAGLLLRHPWSYIAFISPFYWTGWAWIVSSPFESLAYGIISAVITLAAIRLLYKSAAKTGI